MRHAALEVWLTGLALVVCMGLYLFHFSLIWKYAVDVPYQDEWASFEPNQLPIGLSLDGLVAQHNEHRLATTRLLVWLQYRLNGWNLAIHQVLNFVLYGLTVLVILWVTTREAPRHLVLPILCFAGYVFSPINHFNHFMGYQSQVHLWLLLFVSASYFLLSEVANWRDLIIGILVGVLSIYSMASGVVASFTLIVMVTLLKAIRIPLFRKSSRYAGNYFPAILIVIFLGTAIITWLTDYRRPSYHPALVLPYEFRFWGHFLNIVALGFGIDRVSNVLGFFCLLIVLVPLVGLVTIYGRNLPIGLWRNVTLTVAMLAVLASASVGRAGFGLEQAKHSRNFELAMPLLLLSVVNWSVLLQKRKSLMMAAIVSLWVVCFFAFFDNWQQFKYYKREAVRRQMGLKCLEAYYEHKGDGNCPTIFPVQLPAGLLRQAKALKVSFYRRISSDPGNVITNKNLHLRTESQLK